MLLGSGTYPNASRIAAATFTQSWLPGSAAETLVGDGLSTQRMTKNPIISMTRSANVKIHSGHSSHSVFLHRHGVDLAIGRSRG